MARRFLFLLPALVLAAGCSQKGVSVKVTSEDRDIFQNPEGARSGPAIPPPEGAAVSGRAPFLSLDSYDWDYAAWLEDLADAVSALRLPDSADTFVDLLFAPGRARPEIATICTAPPEQCDWLDAQLAELGALPPLPADFPHAGLAVRLSRLP